MDMYEEISQWVKKTWMKGLEWTQDFSWVKYDFQNFISC
jgi:hypothetical protein